MIGSKVKKEGKVYGFEPDPFNYENCLDNIKLNDFTNVFVSQIGLGETVGSYDLIVDTESNRGGNRISLKETNKSATKIEVNTLDNWIQENNISKVDVIKIDVEGFEYKVLKGGEKLLKQKRPTLFIELDDENLKAVGDDASSLVKLLEKLDYKVYNSIDNTPIYSTDDFSNCHYDIIAKAK
jgi:FkbM family methyltransferase